MDNPSPIQLMHHQADAAQRCADHPRYGFWLDCGVGKTIAMLAALHASKAAADAVAVFPEGVTTVKAYGAELRPMPYHKTVVVCPKAIMRNAWERDAEHFPDLNVVVCWANTPAKRAALINTPDADILVINFEMFKKHRKDLYAAGVRRLIVDESSKLKSPTTQITRATIEFADHMESVYLLSGTPAPNDDTEYWAQMRCIDKGIFGDSFYRYAGEYFTPQKRKVGGKDVITGWRAKPHQRDRFIHRLRMRSWSLRKADALDLPDQMDVIHEFDLGTDERRVYDDTEAMLKAEVDGETLNVQASGLVNKLRQVCNGWAYTSADTALAIGDSKRQELLAILDGIGSHACVIWVDYREDARRVAAMLEERGERCAVLDGSTKGSDVKPAVDAFQAGELTRLVCHPASVGHGITLTAASYAVFYSPIWSAELYVQARDRIHRKGQVNKCTYYHLVARDTVERGVLWACRNKRSKSEAIMKMLGREGVTA